MGDGMCLYEAMEMQKRAIADGKILNIEMLFEDSPKGHAVCSGVVEIEGTESIVYTIEPTDGKPKAKAKAANPKPYIAGND